MIDITDQVADAIADVKGEGIVTVFSMHTTCGVTVNENADPDVQSDMTGMLNKLIPQNEPHFQHGEKNSDAHIKTSMIGTDVTIPVENGRLVLGTWQGIFLCEFDGPRTRKLMLAVLSQ